MTNTCSRDGVLSLSSAEALTDIAEMFKLMFYFYSACISIIDEGLIIVDDGTVHGRHSSKFDHGRARIDLDLILGRHCMKIRRRLE